MTICEPWKRVEPISLPSSRIEQRLLAMSPDDFAALVHANLLPRHPEGRELFRIVWGTIAANDELADRTADLLEEWIATSQQAVGTDPTTDRRVAKFIQTANAALDRIDQPLAWAGPEARKYNLPARGVIEKLVDAIDTHRSTTPNPTPEDRQLWAVLGAVGLDIKH